MDCWSNVFDYWSEVFDYRSDVVDDRGNMVDDRSDVDDGSLLVLMAMLLLMMDVMAYEGLRGGGVTVAVSMKVVLGTHRCHRSREENDLIG